MVKAMHAPRRESVDYNGSRYYLQSTGQYFQDGNKDAPERLLHRRIWSDHHGSIPRGVEIHHVDGNWRHNRIENLEPRKKGAHQRAHMLKLMAQPEFRSRALAGLKKAQRAATAWHRTPAADGLHKLAARRSWEVKRPVSVQCIACGKTVDAWFESRKKFCSTACEAALDYRRYFTDRRDCAFCGESFLAHKYRKVRCCSYTCSNRLRAGHLPDK